MSADYFLKLDGVKGESADAKRSGEIEIDSFSWGETNSTSIGSATGGAGAGKVKFDSAVFTTRSSSASPLLAQLCAAGTHIAKAVLTVRKAGGKQEDYYKVTFTTVFITNYRSVGRSGFHNADERSGTARARESINPDAIPVDEVTFVFGQYVFEYRPQDSKGNLGSAVLGGWDQVANKKA